MSEIFPEQVPTPVNPLTQPGGHSPEHAPLAGRHLRPAPVAEQGRDPEVEAAEAKRVPVPVNQHTGHDVRNGPEAHS